MKPREIRPEHLAEAAGLSVDRLWAFARNIDACYKPRRMQWDGKKHRPIYPLYNPAKRILKKLHNFFQANHLCHRSAHGGVRGRSCFTSARKHVGGRYVWTRDAADCYPSISPAMLGKELINLGFRHDTAKVLTMLFTYCNGIPQGSPISGDAINLFFWRLDQYLSSLAGAWSLRNSRVADDFVFSGKDKDAGDKVAQILEDQLQRRGLAVNAKKKAKAGVQTPSHERCVHSISVAKPAGTAISRSQSATAMKVAEQYVAMARSVSAESIEAVANKRSELTGWMYYCRQATFGPARILKARLDAGGSTCNAPPAKCAD